MTNYETFQQLHYQPQPLLIGNVWDVVSARAFERKGFKAIATSSAAVARTMGYEDGEQMPFELLLTIVERITKSVSIPVSVDMESGYSRSKQGIVDNVAKLSALGVVGINMEDSSKQHKGEMMAVDEFCDIISAIAKHLSATNTAMFINARTDAFVHKLASPVKETAMRAKAYELAGANGIFVPFLYLEDDIKTIVQSTTLPVSVFSMPQLPSFKKLGSLGIKRISMGAAMHRAVTASLEKKISTVLEEGSFANLYNI